MGRGWSGGPAVGAGAGDQAHRAVGEHMAEIQLATTRERTLRQTVRAMWTRSQASQPLNATRFMAATLDCYLCEHRKRGAFAFGDLGQPAGPKDLGVTVDLEGLRSFGSRLCWAMWGLWE